MKLQQMLSFVRRAVDDYHMIEDGDRIAVGISGGKDSLAMLYALNGLKRFYPKKFEIHAVTVDLGFQNLNLDKIRALCEELQVEYTIVKTDIAKIVFDDRKESNPCALCAKMRKGALNEAINYVKELAGSKVNVIWGTVTQENHDQDKIVVTLIATGMTKAPRTPSILPKQPVREVTLREYKMPTPKKEMELKIPPFLQEAGKKVKRQDDITKYE